jgi:hypothetical protein
VTANKTIKPAATNTMTATNTNTASAKKIIKLPKKDFEAVNRLKEFGFSQQDVLEAYFACDKNERLFAHFYLIRNKINMKYLKIECSNFNFRYSK